MYVDRYTYTHEFQFIAPSPPFKFLNKNVYI